MRLTVNLVTWNGGKYIPFLFDSLRKQTFQGWKLQILDNGSNDNTVEAIENELKNFSNPFSFKKEPQNLGFAGGHNLLYKGTDSEFLILLNQDIYLQPDCFSNLIACLESNEWAGSATPKLLKWNFHLADKGKLQESFTSEVDSLGLQVMRNRQIKETAEISSQNPVHEIFGVSGALPIYKMSALKRVEFENGTIFDELYHSYKEDVDLAFRLSAAGWKSFVVMNAIAYHDRSASGPKQDNMRGIIKNKKFQSGLVKYNSYKNHLMTLYKNEYRENFILDVFSILWYEIRKFIYYLFTDPKVLMGLLEVFENRREITKKREWINKTKILKAEDVRKWWV